MQIRKKDDQFQLERALDKARKKRKNGYIISRTVIYSTIKGESGLVKLNSSKRELQSHRSLHIKTRTVPGKRYSEVIESEKENRELM